MAQILVDVLLIFMIAREAVFREKIEVLLESVHVSSNTVTYFSECLCHHRAVLRNHCTSVLVFFVVWYVA